MATPMLRSLVLALLAALALAACKKDEAGAASAPTASSATVAPAATAATTPTAPATAASAPDAISAAEPPLPALGDFKIVQVLMGTTLDDGHVVISDTRSFGAHDAIHASVLSIGAHQGLKLSADWRAPDGSIIAKSEQALVPTSDLATTFNLSNPGAWPAGDYELRLAIDGHTVRSEHFSVR
jgi:pyruvate/2-oxoglutarate dehydrogenase complex dihydrolipoamide acyltransferase (E2) component